MGAEAMGVMELAKSVGMLALTPVTAGIPSAMSRLTARHPICDQPEVLRSGLALIRQVSVLLIPALLLLSPALAWLLGDQRALPAIVLTAPNILLLGLCGVYSGYCCGREDTRTPALNECAEQSVRFVLTAMLLIFLTGRSVALTAALPSLAEAAAGLAAVLLFRRAAALAPTKARPSNALRRQLFRLAAPTTLSRLCVTGMRALGAVLLPVCLRRSGLSAAAATAQFGLLNGMAMPLMMLPGIVTGALSTVATPAVSRQEKNPRQMRRIMLRLLSVGVGIGLVTGTALFLAAEFIGTSLYHQPALPPLVRLLSPTALIFALHQVLYGMITGLGLQKRALTGTILSSGTNLLLTALLASLPGLRIFGAGMAAIAGQMVSLIWNSVLLLRTLKNQPSIR